MRLVTEGGPAVRLPHYDHPPVVEVAMGVQFSRLAGMRQAHLGLIYEQLRSEFPVIEDRPALPPSLDFLAADGPPPLTFQLVNAVDVSRAWFLTSDGDRLIQVQADRFIHNWRGEGSKYPRYESIREAFMRYFDKFTAVVQDRPELGSLVPEFVELNYINRIGDVRHVSDVLTALKPLQWVTPDGAKVPAMEDRFGAVYELPKPSTGLLILNAERLNLPGRPLGLTLTYRTRARDLAELPDLYDRGHVTIVTAFDQFTAPALHEHWGKQS